MKEFLWKQIQNTTEDKNIISYKNHILKIQWSIKRTQDKTLLYVSLEIHLLFQETQTLSFTTEALQ